MNKTTKQYTTWHNSLRNTGGVLAVYAYEYTNRSRPNASNSMKVRLQHTNIQSKSTTLKVGKINV